MFCHCCCPAEQADRPVGAHGGVFDDVVIGEHAPMYADNAKRLRVQSSS